MSKKYVRYLRFILRSIILKHNMSTSNLYQSDFSTTSKIYNKYKAI